MSDHDAIVAVDPCRRIIDAAESLLNRLNPNVPWSAEALELQHALVAWERVEAAEDRAGELQAQVERLERERDEAGLPEHIKMHEMRHSAADAIYRQRGDVSMAQMLLRHESLSTTQAYLHPTKTDLAATLRVLDEAWQGSK